jgi:hypothetical protein
LTRRRRPRIRGRHDEKEGKRRGRQVRHFV